MSLVEKVYNDPAGFGNEIISRETIEEEVKNTLKLIERIEEDQHKVLVGDRRFLDRPFIDCKNMTNAQALQFFSLWRAGIIARYKNG